MRRILDWFWLRGLGVVLGLLALLLFVLTMARGVVPGQSAELLARYGGLFPMTAPERPIWGWLVDLVWNLPLGSAVGNVTFLSALFGAVCVGLLYHAVSAGLTLVSGPPDLTVRRGAVLARVAGVVAALALCFSTPFWIVATRAHNATCDIALLLGALALLILYGQSRGCGWLYVLAFVWGIGTVEYASFIIFFPLVLVVVLALMWRKGQLRGLPVVSATGCGLLGLSLYLVVAWRFYGSEGHAIRDYPGYFSVVWILWKTQYQLIMSSLPREGWLLVILTTGVPWVVGLGVARRGIKDAPEWSDSLLHIVLSVLSLLVLLNLQVAPWALLGHARLLVMPYVLTAALTGYLVAYWLRVGLSWGPMPSGKGGSMLSRALGWLFLLGLTASVLASPFRNHASADTRQVENLNDCASMIVNAAAAGGDAESAWIVSDGVMDDLIRVMAHQKGASLQLLDLSSAGNPVYAKYLANHVDTPRLKNLARIGVVPLLQELFVGTASIKERTVMLVSPDLWTLAGRRSVPDRLVFRGAEDVAEMDFKGVYDEHVDFFATVVPGLKEAAARDDVADPIARTAYRLLRQCSLMANNLGVLLEDHQRAELAFGAYAQARDILPSNISALLNRVRMVEAGHPSDLAEEIRSRFAELLAAEGRFNIMGLAARYGYVREPNAFNGIARMWAFSGQPGMAVASTERALELAGKDEAHVLKASLARLHLDQSRDKESEALFYELLVEDPGHAGALMGLARISARKGAFDDARQYLIKAEHAGVEAPTLALERAVIAVLQRDDAAAREALDALLREDGKQMFAWRMLLEILIRQQDWDRLEDASIQLRSMAGGETYVAEIEAVFALRDGDLPTARRALELARSTRPNDVALLHRTLRLALLSGTPSQVEKYARMVLHADSGDALGNYAIGAVRVASGELELAEDALRRSMVRQRLPRALNDLAWLLQAKKAYAEAETLAREATALRPTMHQAWDTLGEILMRQGKLTEAEVALEKVLSLTPDSLAALLHMAQLQAAKGDEPHAREILLMIASRADRLSSKAKAEYDALHRALGDD